MSSDTNVGLGLVECRKGCRCADCQIDRLQRENAALTAEVSRLTENQRLQDSATAAVMERAEKLTARVAELERDAGRYRWLRDQNWTQRGLFVVSANNQDVVRLGTNCPSGELLDAAIDAGRRTE